MATHVRSGLAIGPKNIAQEWSRVIVATGSVDPGSINAGLTEDVAATVTGAVSGDLVIAHPATDLEAGLVVSHAWVSATDEVTVRVENATAGAVNGDAKTWTFVLWRRV